MFRQSKNGQTNDLGDLEFRQPLLTSNEDRADTLFDADDSDDDDGILGDLNTPYTSRTTTQREAEAAEAPARAPPLPLRSTIASREAGVYVTSSANLLGPSTFAETSL
jgi:hypothetical protein